jgi:hypothetical protein
VQRILASADTLNGTLRTAEALARLRRRIDLAGLDGHVAELCARAAALPAEEARRVRPQLETLLGRVDALLTTLANARATATGS